MIIGKIAAIVNMADDDIYGITRERWYAEQRNLDFLPPRGAYDK